MGEIFSFLPKLEYHNVALYTNVVSNIESLGFFG